MKRRTTRADLVDYKAKFGGVTLTSSVMDGDRLGTYVRLSNRRVKKTVEALPGIFVDLDANGGAIGVEIL